MTDHVVARAEAWLHLAHSQDDGKDALLNVGVGLVRELTADVKRLRDLLALADARIGVQASRLKLLRQPREVTDEDVRVALGQFPPGARNETLMRLSLEAVERARVERS